MTDTRVARWSQYLIYFILAVLPLERIPSFELTYPITATIRLSQIAGLVLILINVPFLWRRRRDLLAAPWRWLVLFWFVSLLSVALSLDLKRSISVFAFTVFVGLLAWVFSLRVRRQDFGRYATILIWTAVVTCLFGLYQFFGDLLGLSTHWTGLRPQYTSGVFGFPRIQSTGLEPLYYDNFLLIPAALLMTYLAKGRRRLWSWLALTFISTIVFVNISRGAIVALIILGVMMIIWQLTQKRLKAAGLVALGLIIGAGLAVGLIDLGSHIPKQKTTQSQHAVSNFTQHATDVSSGESSEFRTLSRHVALQGWRQHPWLGVGPGNFGLIAHKLDPNGFADNKAIVNNEPIELLVETGAIGLAAFLIFVLSLAGLATRSIRRLKSSDERYWSVALALALVAIAIQYQLFSTLYITHIWVAIGLLVGLTGKPGMETKA